MNVYWHDIFFPLVWKRCVVEVKQPQIMKLFFLKRIQMITSTCYSFQDHDEPLCLPSVFFVYGLSSIVFSFRPSLLTNAGDHPPACDF